MTPEMAAALLVPFPEEMIGKLPRVTCQPCSKSQTKVCNEHRKIKCDGCGNWISERHIHLDYVGHAATTKRLLEVDPEWTWEPVAVDGNGAPALASGGLWIRMTVGGVTRLGWGDGPDIKQMISDAIRNAAMRFGVALDLWSKEDLRAHDENAEGAVPQVRAAEARGTTAAAPSATSESRGSQALSTASAGSSSSPASGSPPQGGDDGPAVSKARQEKLKSRCVALNEVPGVSIADEREALQLPLVDSCSLEQIEAFERMVDEIEKRLEAPFAEAKS